MTSSPGGPRLLRAGAAVFLLVPAAAALVGCGQKPPTPADPEQGRQALRTALEAWKNGDSPDALRKGSPAINVADEDWAGGAKLLAYKIAPKDQMSGTNLRCAVNLSLRDRKGRAVERKAVYLVTTQPTISIVRQDS